MADSGNPPVAVPPRAPFAEDVPGRSSSSAEASSSSSAPSSVLIPPHEGQYHDPPPPDLLGDVSERGRDRSPKRSKYKGKGPARAIPPVPDNPVRNIQGRLSPPLVRPPQVAQPQGMFDQAQHVAGIAPVAVLPPWAASIMMNNLSMERFDGTNIFRAISNIEDLARQFSYPEDNLLTLLKQNTSSRELAEVINQVTAGLGTWQTQKQQLIAFFKTDDKSMRADPNEVIKGLHKDNPGNDLREWKARVVEYNQVLSDARDPATTPVWPFYKCLPPWVKKSLLLERRTGFDPKTVPWPEFKSILLDFLNREIEYARQDVSGTSSIPWDQPIRPFDDVSPIFNHEQSSRSGTVPDQRPYPAKTVSQDDPIDRITKGIADMKIDIIKFFQPGGNGFAEIQRHAKARSYNARRDDLGLSGPGAVSSVQAPAIVYDNDSGPWSDDDDEVYMTINGVQYRKDGSVKACYGCANPDHNAYHCPKLEALANHQLVHCLKWEGTSVIIGTLQEAEEGLAEYLDPDAVRRYRDQPGAGIDAYVRGRLEFLSQKNRVDLPCVQRYRRVVESDPSFKGNASLGTPKTLFDPNRPKSGYIRSLAMASDAGTQTVMIGDELTCPIDPQILAVAAKKRRMTRETSDQDDAMFEPIPNTPVPDARVRFADEESTGAPQDTQDLGDGQNFHSRRSRKEGTPDGPGSAESTDSPGRSRTKKPAKPVSAPEEVAAQAILSETVKLRASDLLALGSTNSALIRRLYALQDGARTMSEVPFEPVRDTAPGSRQPSVSVVSAPDATHGQSIVSYKVNSVSATTRDVVNRGCCGSAYLTVRVGDDTRAPMSALLDTGAEMNLLPLSYCNDNSLSYAQLESMNSTVYNGESLSLIGVTENWVCIGHERIRQVFFVVDDITHNVAHHILLGMPFFLDTNLTFEKSNGFLFAHVTMGDSRVMCGLGRRNQKPFSVAPAAGAKVPERYIPRTSAIRAGTDQPDQDEVRIGNLVQPSKGWPSWLKLEEGDEVVGLLTSDDLKRISAIHAKEVQAQVKTVCQEEGISQPDHHCVCGSHRVNRVACFRKWVDNIPSPATAAKAVRRTLAPAIRTLYKRVGVKVHPVDDHPSDGSVPDGTVNWKPSHEEKIREAMDANRGSIYDAWIRPKFSDIPRGSRLTPDRLAAMMEKSCDGFSVAERNMFVHMLFNREKTLAWEFAHVSQISTSVAPPQSIKTVPHKAYQNGNNVLPRALREIAIKMLRERQASGLIEESHASYRNKWFLVSKKDKGYRLINDVSQANSVTIRDAFIPPAADEFSEEFAMCMVLSLLDFFSGYDQIKLDEKSRDITTFATPIGLFRQCGLPMGATNSIAQFMRCMVRLFYDLIPQVCRPFMDDIAVKGPTTDYGGQEAPDLPGVRRFVAEHIKNLDDVLYNTELAGGVISAMKSDWCKKQADIVGYTCGTLGRSPTDKKIIKIKEWTTCTTVSQVRSFIGLANYYRAWIPDYGIIAKPLFNLLKKGAVFAWDDTCKDAMDQIKAVITSKPYLINLDYAGGDIILMVDASLLGWGACLMQVVDGVRYPVRYESGAWTEAEKLYDATKRECRAVLYAIRRLRFYVFGVHFFLETDSNVLVWQLKGSATDVPGALITRWLAVIRTYDFTVVHVKGSDNPVADALSRKPAGPSDDEDRRHEGDIEDWCDLTLAQLSAPESEADQTPLLRDDCFWSEQSKQIARFLVHGELPLNLKGKRLDTFRRTALQFVVHEQILWRLPEKKLQRRRVVDDPDQKQRIIRNTHAPLGHRGREATYGRIRAMYYWKGMYTDVEKAISTCPKCAKWDTRHYNDGVIPTVPDSPFAKIHIDVQHLPSDRGCAYLVEARCDLTGWPEAMALRAANAKSIRRFFVDNILLKWGLPLKVVVDGGRENMGEFAEYLRQINVRRVLLSAYNPRANGIVEQGHFNLVAAMMKMMDEHGVKSWRSMLPYALFADRTSPRRSHGKSPFYLLHGYEPIIPIETDIPTWRVQAWDPNMSTEDALICRLRSLLNLKEDVLKARDAVAEYRKKAASRDTHRGFTRPQPLVKDDLVLVIDEQRKTDHSSFRKLTYRWFGPFIIESVEPNNVYKLRTPDNVPIDGTFSPRRLKKFVKHDGIWEPEVPSLWAPQSPLVGASDSGEGDSSQAFPDPMAPMPSADIPDHDDNPDQFQDWSDVTLPSRVMLRRSSLTSISSSSSASSDSSLGYRPPVTRSSDRPPMGPTQLDWYIDIPPTARDDTRRTEYETFPGL